MDLISRQAALDALGERPTVWTDDDDYALGERNQYDMDRLAIETMPPAQLAQDLTNGCTDTISRVAAGDALNRIEISRNASWYEFYQKALTAVGTLPSAQPEIIRCKDCRYNNDCEIQYSAQSADEFFCGCAERKDNE